MQADTSDDYVTPTEASRLLNRSAATVKRWQRKGLLTPAIQRVNWTLFRREDVLALAARRGK